MDHQNLQSFSSLQPIRVTPRPTHSPDKMGWTHPVQIPRLSCPIRIILFSSKVVAGELFQPDAQFESPPGREPPGRLFVPSTLWLEVHCGHYSALSGHPGIRRTLTFNQRAYWWPALDNQPASRECSLSSGYHPLTNGQRERTNQQLEHFLSCFGADWQC